MGKRLIKFIKYFFECVLLVIYGNNEKCSICENYIDDVTISKVPYICSNCLSKIVRVKGKHVVSKDNVSVDSYSACYYSGIVVELIRRLKYKSDFYAGCIISRIMIDTIISEEIKFDIITYVPCDYITLKKRGYNQSQYLAKRIEAATGIKCINLLTKVKYSRDQIGLGKFSRWENLNNCYKANNNINIREKNVLLVDDVITTGATAYFCCKELKKSGANSVILLTGAKSSL